MYISFFKNLNGWRFANPSFIYKLGNLVIKGQHRIEVSAVHLSYQTHEPIYKLASFIYEIRSIQTGLNRIRKSFNNLMKRRQKLKCTLLSQNSYNFLQPELQQAIYKSFCNFQWGNIYMMHRTPALILYLLKNLQIKIIIFWKVRTKLTHTHTHCLTN